MSDPGFTRMSMVKYTVKVCLFSLVFNDGRWRQVVPAISFLFVYTMVYALGEVCALVCPLALKQLPNEAVPLLLNCELMLRYMVQHLRLPKMIQQASADSISEPGSPLTDSDDSNSGMKGGFVAGKPKSALPLNTTFQSTATENEALESTLRELNKRISAQLRHLTAVLGEAKEETFVQDIQNGPNQSNAALYWPAG